MPRVTYIEADGTQYPVNLQEGQSLMEGAVLNEVPSVIGLCGGICSCATCHCYIDEPWAARIPAPEPGELEMLESAFDRRADSRLGCQVAVTDALDGMVVRLPSEQAS